MFSNISSKSEIMRILKQYCSAIEKKEYDSIITDTDVKIDPIFTAIHESKKEKYSKEQIKFVVKCIIYDNNLFLDAIKELKLKLYVLKANLPANKAEYCKYLEYLNFLNYTSKVPSSTVSTINTEITKINTEITKANKEFPFLKEQHLFDEPPNNPSNVPNNPSNVPKSLSLRQGKIKLLLSKQERQLRSIKTFSSTHNNTDISKLIELIDETIKNIKYKIQDKFTTGGTLNEKTKTFITEEEALKLEDGLEDGMVSSIKSNLNSFLNRNKKSYNKKDYEQDINTLKKFRDFLVSAQRINKELNEIKITEKKDTSQFTKKLNQFILEYNETSSLTKIKLIDSKSKQILLDVAEDIVEDKKNLQNTLKAAINIEDNETTASAAKGKTLTLKQKSINLYSDNEFSDNILFQLKEYKDKLDSPRSDDKIYLIVTENNYHLIKLICEIKKSNIDTSIYDGIIDTKSVNNESYEIYECIEKLSQFNTKISSNDKYKEYYDKAKELCDKYLIYKVNKIFKRYNKINKDRNEYLVLYKQYIEKYETLSTKSEESSWKPFSGKSNLKKFFDKIKDVHQKIVKIIGPKELKLKSEPIKLINEITDIDNTIEQIEQIEVIVKGLKQKIIFNISNDELNADSVFLGFLNNLKQTLDDLKKIKKADKASTNFLDYYKMGIQLVYYYKKADKIYTDEITKKIFDKFKAIIIDKTGYEIENIYKKFKKLTQFVYDKITDAEENIAIINNIDQIEYFLRKTETFLDGDNNIDRNQKKIREIVSVPALEAFGLLSEALTYLELQKSMHRKAANEHKNTENARNKASRLYQTAKKIYDDALNRNAQQITNFTPQEIEQKKQTMERAKNRYNILRENLKTKNEQMVDAFSKLKEAEESYKEADKENKKMVENETLVMDFLIFLSGGSALLGNNKTFNIPISLYKAYKETKDSKVLEVIKQYSTIVGSIIEPLYNKFSSLEIVFEKLNQDQDTQDRAKEDKKYQKVIINKLKKLQSSVKKLETALLNAGNKKNLVKKDFWLDFVKNILDIVDKFKKFKEDETDLNIFNPTSFSKEDLNTIDQHILDGYSYLYEVIITNNYKTNVTNHENIDEKKNSLKRLINFFDTYKIFKNKSDLKTILQQFCIFQTGNSIGNFNLSDEIIQKKKEYENTLKKFFKFLQYFKVSISNIKHYLNLEDDNEYRLHLPFEFIKRYEKIRNVITNMDKLHTFFSKSIDIVMQQIQQIQQTKQIQSNILQANQQSVQLQNPHQNNQNILQANQQAVQLQNPHQNNQNNLQANQQAVQLQNPHQNNQNNLQANQQHVQLQKSTQNNLQNPHQNNLQANQQQVRLVTGGALNTNNSREIKGGKTPNNINITDYLLKDYVDNSSDNSDIDIYSDESDELDFVINYDYD